ncbi:putative holin [Serratia fonticola]|uniref:putative holin n=1 Tax=Serratia fonticola TaxID=47917 RepID=UPI0039870E33
MAEPVTTTTTVAGGAVTGVAVMTFFAGAILFVVSASEYGIRSRLILAIGSFTAGLTMYKPAAAWIVDFLPAGYDRGADAAGALLAAGCVIRLLMMINSGGGFLRKRGGSDGDS